MDLTEFCKDMPERQPVDPNDYVPIDMYPGYEFYVGKPNVDLRSKIYILIRLAGTDLRELKRLLEEWFFLYPNKKHLIDQIRKYTIRDRGNRIPNKSFMKMVSGIEHYEIMDVLSKFVDEHTVSLYKDHSAQPEGLKCLDKFKSEDLKFIYSKLTGSGRLPISVTETNFVATFQGGKLPDGWQKLKWIGSNPELATLINQLTGLRPIPSIVKPLFQTKKEYENVNSSRTTNLPIIELVTAALK